MPTIMLRLPLACPQCHRPMEHVIYNQPSGLTYYKHEGEVKSETVMYSCGMQLNYDADTDEISIWGICENSEPWADLIKDRRNLVSELKYRINVSGVDDNFKEMLFDMLEVADADTGKYNPISCSLNCPNPGITV